MFNFGEITGSDGLEKFKSANQARQELEKFIDRAPLECAPGDYIERNDLGTKKYRFPSENQVMRVIEKTAPVLSDDGDYEDLIVCVAIADGHFKYYRVDSRFYKMAKESKNVFRLIKRST